MTSFIAVGLPSDFGGGGGGKLLPLRIESGRFRTDDGFIVPRFYSVFHALPLVRDGNLTELRRLLQRAATARCNGIRIFGSWYYVGDGRESYRFSMMDRWWFDWMTIVLAEAMSYGLRVELSYFCDAQVLVPNSGDRINLFEGLAQWSVGHPSLIVTVANEARKNGWTEADDPAILDLFHRFRALNRTTLLGVSDPIDAGSGSSVEDYNRRQETIARAGADFLLVHAERKSRYAWVDHLKGAVETPPDVGFNGVCWHQEPMGGASHDVSGRRDGSTIAHVAASCVGAMTGAYTYMHRQLEDDVCPGLLESAKAADIPGSPDYRFYNATLPGSPVSWFTNYDKCRTISNGSRGWAVAYGTREGSITLAPGWREINRTHWSDATGVCDLLEVGK